MRAVVGAMVAFGLGVACVAQGCGTSGVDAGDAGIADAGVDVRRPPNLPRTEDETALLVKALVEYFTRPPALPSLDEMILDEAEADCEAASETLGRPLQEFEEDIVLAACARRFGVGCTKH